MSMLRRCALAALSLFAWPALAATSWVSTATHALQPKDVAVLGALPAQTPLRLLVGLNLRHRAQADAALRAIGTPGNPRYNQWLTPEQFDAEFAPSASDTQAVVDYLQAQGFSDIQVPADRAYVQVRGTAAQVESAFNTPLMQYQWDGRTVFANSQDAQVPAALAHIVSAVIGLQNVGAMRSTLEKTLLPEAGATRLLTELAAQDFWTVYDVGSVPDATGTTIAIFAEGDLTQMPLDLAQARSEQNLPPVNVEVRKTGLDSPDTTGLDEFDLDTQTSTGMAGNVAKLIVYDNGALDDVDLIPGFNQFAVENEAQAGSASFGGCEVLESLTGAITTYDQIFLKSALQGQTIFTSSGDNGAYCGYLVALGVPAGLPFQSFPCSSTYITCVGGTTVLNDTTEIAWYAGGGGLSVIESPGFWTYGDEPLGSVKVPENPVILGGATLPIFKGVPDIAMDGDAQLSPALVVVNGADIGVGGTSLSTPLALGAWARLQSAHGNTLGFAPLKFYPLTSGLFKAATGFRDIVLGTNGEFIATPGWDYTTGLGTMDISALNDALGAQAVAAQALKEKSLDGASGSGLFLGAFAPGVLLPLLLAALRRRRR